MFLFYFFYFFFYSSVCLSSIQCSNFHFFFSRHTLVNCTMTSSFNPGGMPRARRQLFDDHLILEEPDLSQIQQPTHVPDYDQGYNNFHAPPQQQQNKASLSSTYVPRPASSNDNRMSFGIPPSSSNSKSSFFGFKKKHGTTLTKTKVKLLITPAVLILKPTSPCTSWEVFEIETVIHRV